MRHPQALNEACPNAPWALTFSYGRALQSSTLKVRFATASAAPLYADCPARP